MKLLVTIVNQGQADIVTEICHSFNIDFQTIFTGRGTASSELLEMLSLGDKPKEVVLSIVSEKDVSAIIDSLNSHINFSKIGSAVAFSIPIDSMGFATYEYLKEGLGGLTGGK